MTHYFDKIRTPNDLKRLNQRQPPGPSSLGQIPGSAWSTEELQISQVICRRVCSILPILEPHLGGNCSVPKELQAPKIPGLGQYPSETDIYHIVDGHAMSAFWGALVYFDPSALSSSSDCCSPSGQSPTPHGYSPHSANNNTPYSSSSPLRSSPRGPAQRPSPATPRHAPPPGHKRTASNLSAPSPSSAGGSNYDLPRRPRRPGPATSRTTPSPTSIATLNLTRTRRMTSNPGFVDPTHLRIDESSSPRLASSSQQTAEFIDVDTHTHAARDISEDQTVHLLQSFLRSSLHMLQGRNAHTLVEVDLVKSRHSVQALPGINATDDGGLRLRQRLHKAQDEHWETMAQRVALIEAKRQFVSASSDQGATLAIEDDLLGQMLAEALLTRLEIAQDANHPLFNSQDIIIICAAQEYVRLLSFQIPNDYVAAVEASQPLDPLKDTHFVTVHATHIFNLARADDRTKVYRQLSALMGWLKSLVP